MIQESYDVISSSCKSNDLASVNSAFVKIQLGLIILSVKTQLTFETSAQPANPFINKFFSLVSNFQQLLQVVSGYPKILSGCKSTFNGINFHLNQIHSHMRTAGAKFSLSTSSYAKAIDTKFCAKAGISLQLN